MLRKLILPGFIGISFFWVATNFVPGDRPETYLCRDPFGVSRQFIEPSRIHYSTESEIEVAITCMARTTSCGCDYWVDFTARYIPELKFSLQDAELTFRNASENNRVLGPVKRLDSGHLQQQMRVWMEVGLDGCDDKDSASIGPLEVQYQHPEKGIMQLNTGSCGPSFLSMNP